MRKINRVSRVNRVKRLNRATWVTVTGLVPQISITDASGAPVEARTETQPPPPPKPAPAQRPAVSGFPRFWNLFPVILPRSVRERIHDPAAEELKEDFIVARSKFRTKWARRWVTFAFTARTIALVWQSLWAVAGGAFRKFALGAAAVVFGPRAVEAAREWIAGWLGRLP